jgi:hypothetical protein
MALYNDVSDGSSLDDARLRWRRSIIVCRTLGGDATPKLELHDWFPQSAHGRPVAASVAQNLHAEAGRLPAFFQPPPLGGTGTAEFSYRNARPEPKSKKAIATESAPLAPCLESVLATDTSEPCSAETNANKESKGW